MDQFESIIGERRFWARFSGLKGLFFSQVMLDLTDDQHIPEQVGHFRRRAIFPAQHPLTTDADQVPLPLSGSRQARLSSPFSSTSMLVGGVH
ncbi:MAG: hypothetical protein IPK53_08370 [bacterium]|nr:hypothetical protein [bacterium]